MGRARRALFSMCALPLVVAVPVWAQGAPPDAMGGAGAGGAPSGGGSSFSSGGSSGGGGGSSGASAGGMSGGPDNLLGLVPVEAPKVISLPEAMELATRANFDLRIAQERIVQSEANVRRAWAALLPQVSLAGNYTFNYPEQRASFGSAEANQQQALLYSNLANIVESTAVLNSDPQSQAAAAEQAEQLRAVATQLENTKPLEVVVSPMHVLGANLNVTVPVFNGRALPLLQNAYEAVDLVRLGNEQARTALLHAVARAYYAAVTAEKLIEIAERQKHSSEKHRDATRDRVELGVATPLTLQRAELDVLRAEQQVRAARNTYLVALGAVGNLIGVEEEFRVLPPEPLPTVELEGDDEALITRALNARQDLKVQKGALAIADRNRLDAWMQFLPTVGLTAQGRWTSNTAGFANQPVTGAVILSASIPIYDGGTRYAALKESGSKIREELLRVRQLELKIKGQVRGNIADIGIKREALVQAQHTVELSKKTAQNAENLYELGVATSLDVIDANLALFLSEIQLAQAELDLEQSRMGLSYILGEFPPATTVAPLELGDDEADEARKLMDATIVPD